jgi:hypothetical protein
MKHGISPTTPKDWQKGRPQRYIKMMPATGKNRDPARVLSHLARRGPLIGAHGPGSINAESDMRHLIATDRGSEAATLFESHHRIRGARPLLKMMPWYELFIQGSVTADLTSGTDRTRFTLDL